jgi:bifunctional DNase/RNase
MLEVRLAGVRVDRRSNSPVVLLKELSAPGRALPIFVGTAEATAIAFAVDHVEVPRPMTHDLFRDVLGALGAELARVRVTEVLDETYHAMLDLVREGTRYEISARPSDAIALALRTEAPIFVEDALMERAGVVLLAEDPAAPGEVANPDELIDQFREFLGELRPEDFRP